MASVKKRPVAPFYAVAILWLVWGLFFPLYKPIHFILAAIVTVIVFCIARLIWPNKTYQTTEPEPEKAEQEKGKKEETKKEETPAGTGNPELDAMLLERDRAVSEMRRLNDSIEDPVISQQIDQLESSTKKIFAQVLQHPEKMPQIRRFMNYYLPTTLKLLNAYDRMDDTGIEGGNISGTKVKVSSIMGTIVDSFEKQLDALFGSEALDISTDIAVMEQMLAREGLGDSQMNIEETIKERKETT